MTVALIDGDIVLHMCMWKSETLADFQEKAHVFLDNIPETVFCDEFLLALGGPNNFRDEIYPAYKQIPMRVKGRGERPPFFYDAKDYLARLPGAVVSDGIEADDLLGHWSSSIPDASVIVSIDKDLNQLPGIHFNPRLFFSTGINEGSAYYISPKESFKFLMFQLLMGDPMDNIPGVPKIGPVKAKALINSEGFNHKKVIELYKQIFGEDWQNNFLLNGKLLFIQRKPNDWFTLERFDELADQAEV